MNALYLHQSFEDQAAKRPGAVAVTCGQTALTYGALNEQANQLAHQLRTQGVGPDTLVGLCVERTVDMIVAMLGILKAGGAYLPLDPAYPGERLRQMVHETKLSVLVTQAALGAKVAPVLATFAGTVVYLDRDEQSLRNQPRHNVDMSAIGSPDSLMYVIYTSGSTGKPKGIMVSHRNVARLFVATKPHLFFDETDSWTLFHSYSFGFSVWEIWGAFVHGGRLVIVPPDICQSPDDFYRLVCREKITVLSQTPSAFSLFLLADRANKHSDTLNLRFVVFSGETLDPVVLQDWIARHGDEHPQLVNMYAITETAGEITYRRLKAADANGSTRSVIGTPLHDVNIYILDEANQPVPTGNAGEMYVGSEAVARGYFGQPELTAQKFVANSFGPGFLYRTGDRARFLPNGEIEFLGRADDQVKIRGHRVELGEIQSTLLRHPAIHEAVVVAHTDRAQHTSLVAYVVTKASPLAPREVQAYLRTALPDYMVPGTIVELDKLPRSPNGKLDKSSLPDPAAEVPEVQPEPLVRTDEERALAQMWGLLDDASDVQAAVAQFTAAKSSYAAPQTPIEQGVARIWSELLSRKQIGRTDDFLSLGGNSLLAAQALYRINDAFGVNLSMRQLLDAPTLADLAEVVSQQQATQVDEGDLALLLQEMEGVSDDEVRRLLAEHAAGSSDAPRQTPAKASNERHHETYMRLAMQKAEEAIAVKQAPVAACIVKNGEVIACVYNEVQQRIDVTAHAEMQAIRAACRHLDTIDLSGCVLYSTLEPCPMCLGASEWANISTLVYGARRADAVKAGLGGHVASARAVQALAHSPIVLVDDVLRDDNVKLLARWADTRGRKSSQYDAIAEQFQSSKRSPVNKYIVDYTFLEMIGDLPRGRNVLDLACGEGHYCRILKELGAARVVGVDLSTEMIGLARQQETQQAMGIEYVCKNVLDLGKIGEFDLVVASFLLNYAQTKEQLAAMCKVVADNLRPGGQFILINENIEQQPRPYRGYQNVGYVKTIAEPCTEGSAITYTMSAGHGSFSFQGYYWSKETYEEAFRQAGFHSVRLQKLRCSPRLFEEFGHRLFEEFLNEPPFVGITCRKDGNR